MSKVKKNIVYNIAYQILAIIVPLITSPYLSRVLGAEQIGIYSYTYSIAFYFMIFAVLGINNYGNRTIAKVRDNQVKTNKTFISIYYLQFILSSLTLMFYIIYCVCFVKKYVLISFIQGLYIISNLMDVTWYFYGKENFKITVFRNFIIKILSLILIVLLVKKKSDLWIYAIIMSGSMVFGQALLWINIFKEIKFVKIEKKDIVVHIKPIIILFIPVLAISIFAYMDKVMLGKMSVMYETGFYENSEKIINIPKAIITAVGTVMLPRTSNMFINGKIEEIKKYISITMIMVLFIGFACAFGLIGVANTFSIIFWGDEFKKCGSIISCMTPALVFSVFGNVIRTQYLIPKEMDKEYTISLLLGAFTNFIMNFLLIKKFGAIGATIGTVMAEAVLCLYQIWTVKNELRITDYILSGIPFFIIGLIMLVFIKTIDVLLIPCVTSLMLEVACGSIIYLILTNIYCKYTKNRLIKEVYNNIIFQLKNKIKPIVNKN